MRAFLACSLVFAALFAAACGDDEDPAQQPAAQTATAQASSPCAKENLSLYSDGKLTVGTDKPAYPPYFEDDDPTNGKGFESAVGFAIADEMGFAKDAVTWIYTGFNNAIAPGPKDFDLYITQVSYSPERAQAVDISDGYYDLTQSLVVPAKSKFAKAATIADLKDMQLGAQVGTTSLKTITDVVAPSKEPKVYDSNDAAVAALQNGQIDGLVVDLPTASYVSGVQLGDGIIVGQFADSAAGEHFGAALDKDSPLTACVNAAIGRLDAAGTLDALATQWLPDLVSVPVFQP